MILAGDERGHTQNGNNNVYCQDNETAWLNWEPTPSGDAFFAFVQRVIALRRAHPSFRRRNFFHGKPLEGSTVKDVCWLKPDGHEMTPEDWNDVHARCLAMLIAGNGISERGPRGEALRDDDFLLLFNAHHDEIAFTLPSAGPDAWHLMLDTANETLPPTEGDAAGGVGPAWASPSYPLQSRSFVLLSRAAPDAEDAE